MPAVEVGPSPLPYPGLRAFQREETDIFFGREEQTDELLRRLQRGRFLAVVGASGCGKSSLVRAGMMAALEAGFMSEAGSRWRLAEMRPGMQPLERLADALLEKSALGTERPETEEKPFLLATLRRGPLGLVEVMQETPPPDGTNLLLLVDQFEEIFRFHAEGNIDEAEAFVNLLLASVQQTKLPIYVVITMRSDYFGECALFSGLPEAINDSQYLTPRPTREQRHTAIVGPARIFGGNVEPELVNRLLNDMGNDPDQLPLLQHVLMRMWARASKRTNPVHASSLGQSGGENQTLTITLDDYQAVGTLKKALSQHGDEIFQALTTEQQRITEEMFRCLTERGRGQRDTRRPARLQDVAQVAAESVAEVSNVVEVFRQPDRSFITPPRVPLRPETILDIGHESLIRQWDRLKEWVEKEAESAEEYQFLKQKAERRKEEGGDYPGRIEVRRLLDWEERQHPTSAWAARYGKSEDFDLAIQFLHESEQQEFLRQRVRIQREEREKAQAAALAEAERQQKAQSQVAESEKKRSRLFKYGLSIVSLLLALTIAQRLYGMFLKENTRSQKIAANALSQLTIDPELSVLLASEAIEINDSPETRYALRKSIIENRLKYDLRGHEEEVNNALFSPNGELCLTVSFDGTARIWRTDTGQQINKLKHPDDQRIHSAAFSPDNKMVITAAGSNSTHLGSGENGSAESTERTYSRSNKCNL